jgi:hypothetical protein
MRSFFVINVLSMIVSHAQGNGEADGHEHTLELEFRKLDQTMPKSLSDHTAVLWNNKAYIAGGCDSPNGNEWVTDWGSFACANISDSLIIFDTQTKQVREVTLPMPSARYRHASVASESHVWLLGGRDLEDSLITTVDVSETKRGRKSV